MWKSTATRHVTVLPILCIARRQWLTPLSKPPALVPATRQQGVRFGLQALQGCLDVRVPLQQLWTQPLSLQLVELCPAEVPLEELVPLLELALEEHTLFLGILLDVTMKRLALSSLLVVTP